MRKEAVLFCLATVLFIHGVAVAGVGQGLVAYWSFDDCKARDMSGNEHHGKIHGNPGCTEGVVGKALKFDGLDDYIEISVPLQGDRNWSVCSWVNLSEVPDDNDWLALISNSDEGIELGIYNSSGAFAIYLLGAKDIQAPRSTVVVNEDMFVCYTKSSGTLNIFKNGSLIRRKSGPMNFSSLKTIGMWDPISSNPDDKEGINGMIDELRVYDRALSKSEIQLLYHTTPPVSGNTSGFRSMNITCRNDTTGQSVKTKGKSEWDCEKAGLAVSPGDTVTVSITGPVH